MWDFPLLPVQGSGHAARVDSLSLAWLLACGGLGVLVATLLIFFAIRYRSGSKVNRTVKRHSSIKIEVAWVGCLAVLFLGLFAWGAQDYFRIQSPPPDTLDIYVVGRQWMWKVQHPGGQREINELHVPVNRPVKLLITSQDVIHSFYLPTLRIKQDAVPGRLSTIWFSANRVGTYHLFCAEYCGTEHSLMIGRLVVLEEADYQRWLSPSPGGPAIPGSPGTPGAPILSQGAGPFFQLGCNSCHVPGSDLRAPRLEGLFGQEVTLANGEHVPADEEYLRESILEPNARIVAGYPAPSLMPTFKGQLTHEQLTGLIQYIKSLQPARAATQPLPGVRP